MILRLLGVAAWFAKAVEQPDAATQVVRYTDVYGDDLDGRHTSMREVLGRGSGGRYYSRR